MLTPSRANAKPKPKPSTAAAAASRYTRMDNGAAPRDAYALQQKNPNLASARSHQYDDGARARAVSCISPHLAEPSQAANENPFSSKTGKPQPQSRFADEGKFDEHDDAPKNCSSDTRGSASKAAADSKPAASRYTGRFSDRFNAAKPQDSSYDAAPAGKYTARSGRTNDDL